MKLTYSNAEQTAIEAVLEAGETLGNHTGPATLSVPTDPANAEYQAILASGQPIDPYVAPPPPVPTVIGRGQWYHQASLDGLITEDEALEAMSGTIPGSLDPYLANVPAAQRQSVQMLLAGGTLFDRTAPTCQAWITALGWSQQQTETFWTEAAKLE